MNNKKVQEKKTLFWKSENGAVRCELCPHNCLVQKGDAGLCGVRENNNDKMISTVYGYPSALHADPIEKKPLFHFLPGTRSFSIGTWGCNLFCKFCQNWQLIESSDYRTAWHEPENIVKMAQETGCKSIAFTYNEPIIFSEYALDIQKIAKAAGLACIYVTNAYITDTARDKVFSGLNAVNIDLKAFSEEVYKKYIGGRLRPVLDTIKYCVDNGIHTEITTLVIPGVNDDDDHIKKECEWIIENCGEDVPLHINAFHPAYKMMDYPITPRKTLQRTKETAKTCGLHYVYVGNYPGFDNNTYCHQCGHTIIDRNTYPFRLDKKHEHKTPVIWSFS